MNRSRLTRFAWLSVLAAIFTIVLKVAAYFITGSVGLLSDAIESVVNLVGGIMALCMLNVAARPADEDHAYGHSKAEYFSSGVEGGLIVVAAISVVVMAVPRLITPKPLQEIGVGLAVSVAASLINLGVALLLLRVGRQYNSITLEADARHLLTDVWTSVGVLAGVGIMRRSVSGLMDTTLSAVDLATVRRVLDRYAADGVQFHALLTRQAGAWKFVSVHVLVPGQWTVQRGHQLLERIESDIRQALPDSTAFTHLESLDDPASWDDQSLERGQAPRSGQKRFENSSGSS
jgi:divalent metal cation (Fe/Co/Zn/Cd) transporter